MGLFKRLFKRKPKTETPQRIVQVGDVVKITGHSSFNGGDILPIGAELIVEKVIPLHNAIEHEFHVDMNWWILPADYEIIGHVVAWPITVRKSEFGSHPAGHPILGHKDLVRYQDMWDHSVLESSRHVDNVYGFLYGKPVVIDYEK